MSEFEFKQYAQRPRGLKRGSIIKIKGKRGAQIILRADWKRGFQIAPYEGRIESRNLARARGRAYGDLPEARSTWITEDQVTEYAAKRIA